LKCDPGAFTGGVADTRGNVGGIKAVLPLFKVTGTVLVKIFGVSKLTPVGAGTLEVGVAGNTASLIAQIADATGLSTGKLYVGATVKGPGVDIFTDVLGPYIVSDAGAASPVTIDEKSASTNITAGSLFYIILWRPLTADGNVESLF
jgi:hypothetical protein